MIILASKEKLIEFLREEVNHWEKVGGGANMDAFDFDPKETDPQLLQEHGYYTNRDAWLAGVRIKALSTFIQEIDSLPEFTKKR
jgi:hypothetical protein